MSLWIRKALDGCTDKHYMRAMADKRHKPKRETAIQVRPGDGKWLDVVDQWRRTHSTPNGDIPTRSEAIRTLAVLGANISQESGH